MKPFLGRVPHQQLHEETRATLSNGETVVLPKESYVRYVRKVFLPRDHGFGDYDEQHYCVVYTQKGLAMVRLSEVTMEAY